MKIGKYILFIPLIQFIALDAFTQTWYITRGLPNQDERAWGVDVDSTGNAYWAIEEKDQWPYWYYNILLYKIDLNARQLWESASLGGPYNDIAFKTTVKGANVYLSGRTDSTGNPVSGDAFVISYDTNNAGMNWQFIFNPVPDYGYEEIDGLIVQPDGIYLSGWIQWQNTNDMNILIQKISLSGQLIWTNSWDYDNLGKFDGANGHMAIDNHFLYVSAHVNRTNIGSLDGDGALVCFDRTNGAYQWHVTWGDALYDDALGLTMSADSMLYMVGFTGSFGNGSQVYLNKFTRMGQLKWSRIWGGKGTEDSRALVSDGDSIIYVVGATSSYGNGGKDIFVLKYDSSGTLIDSLFWGGRYDEVAHDVAIFGDYLYITGETQSYGNGQITGDHKADGLLLKVNGRTMHAPDSAMTSVISPFSPIRDYALNQNYPNPFNPSTKIRFALPRREYVTLKVFDLLGREMATLVDGKLDPGEHAAVFEGGALPSGVYCFRLETERFVWTRKMLLLK